MKVAVIMFLTGWLLYTEAMPALRQTRSTRSTSRQRELFREVLCLVKGMTLDECQQDATLAQLLQDIPLTESTDRSPEFPAVAPHTSSLIPPPNRRDAFYSDWRRRK